MAPAGGTVRELRIFSVILLLASVGWLGGCALLPATGPTGVDVRAGQTDAESLPYALVRVNRKVTAVLAKEAPRLATAFADRRPPRGIRIGIGDIVAVTIFEATSGGLFIPAEAGVRPGNFISLPTQAVDVNGNISVPYAGNIRANGRTPVEIQQAIVDALKDRAIEPQVVVSVVEQRTSLITILGDVGAPRRIPASAEGERLLDAIARGSGTAGPGSDSWVMLERQGRRATAPFGALVYEPINNIYVHPNDTIYLYREPQTFLAFGAVGNQQQIPFGAWRLTLAEALARAGGLNDNLADAAAVFLYRGETRQVAETLGIDCTPFHGPIIPVIYNLNLRDPAGYFLSTSFEMRNKDVIYISNSISVETSKAMNYFRTIVATVNDPINAAIAAYTLKAVSGGAATSSVIVNTPVPIAAQ